jgi:hypothetical protein
LACFGATVEIDGASLVVVLVPILMLMSILMLVPRAVGPIIVSVLDFNIVSVEIVTGTNCVPDSDRATDLPSGPSSLIVVLCSI